MSAARTRRPSAASGCGPGQHLPQPRHIDFLTVQRVVHRAVAAPVLGRQREVHGPVRCRREPGGVRRAIFQVVDVAAQLGERAGGVHVGEPTDKAAVLEHTLSESGHAPDHRVRADTSRVALATHAKKPVRKFTRSDECG